MRQILCDCTSENEPPRTVKSCANTATRRPLTLPKPVTMPSPGTRCLSRPNSETLCVASAPNSWNEPTSRSSARRSRAVSLPRACCCSMRFWPPPSTARLRIARNFPSGPSAVPSVIESSHCRFSACIHRAARSAPVGPVNPRLVALARCGIRAASNSRASASARSARSTPAPATQASSVDGPPGSAKQPANVGAIAGMADGSIAPDSSVTGTPALARTARDDQRGLAEQGLGVAAALAGNGPIGPVERGVQPDQVGDHLGARCEAPADQLQRETQSAGRAGTRALRHRAGPRRPRRARRTGRASRRSGPPRRRARPSAGRRSPSPRACRTRGLDTSDMIVISVAATRGSSRDASTLGDRRETARRRLDRAPLAVQEREPERLEKAGAAVVGAAAAQADHETRDAAVEEGAHQQARAAARARSHGYPHAGGIRDADDRRDLDHRDGRAGAGRGARTGRRADRLPRRPRARAVSVPRVPTAARTASSVPSPPSAIGRARTSASGHTRCRPAAIAAHTPGASSEPLNESGAMTTAGGREVGMVVGGRCQAMVAACATLLLACTGCRPGTRAIARSPGAPLQSASLQQCRKDVAVERRPTSLARRRALRAWASPARSVAIVVLAVRRAREPVAHGEPLGRGRDGLDQDHVGVGWLPARAGSRRGRARSRRDPADR